MKVFKVLSNFTSNFRELLAHLRLPRPDVQPVPDFVAPALRPQRPRPPGGQPAQHERRPAKGAPRSAASERLHPALAVEILAGLRLRLHHFSDAGGQVSVCQ